MNLFFTSRHLNYFLLARHRKGHGIHSPFVFNLFSEIFLNKPDAMVVKRVNDLLYRLYKDQLIHEYDLLFDRSLKLNIITEKARGVAKYPTGWDKYCTLLTLLAGKSNSFPVLQLGGGLTMSTLALAAGASASSVILVEERAEAETLKPDHSFTRLTGNIDLRLVDTYESIREAAIEGGKAGVVLISANRCINKLLYCIDLITGIISDETIVVIEDIHFSAERESEWKRLISDERVSVSIDLLRYGLLFFRKGITKQHFLIRY